MLPHLSDNEIVRATLQNPDQYTLIVERYEDALMRYVRRMV